jgi:hypothetical protein
MTDLVTSNYALIKDGVVTNIVLIDELTPEIESSLIGNNDEFIQIDTTDLWYVSIGSIWDGTNFFPVDTKKPYPSWSWDVITKSFKSPVSKPDFDIESPVFYKWNESVLEWEPI